MAILFDWFENPKRTDGEETTLHARPCFNGKVETSALVHKIQQRSSLTPGDMLAVLTELSDILGEELQEGRQVHIDGIGYFSPTLTVDGHITPDMPLRERNRRVRFKGISFRMDKTLKQHIDHVKVSMTRWETHSQPSTVEEREQRLTEYFSTHAFLTRRGLQSLLNLKRTTAATLLLQWRTEGKLINQGTAKQPIYVPAPGHFGR